MNSPDGKLPTDTRDPVEDVLEDIIDQREVQTDESQPLLDKTALKETPLPLKQVG
jgi:hypothetical protein